MLSKLNQYFASNETALKLRGLRQEVIASNIANGDTPGYKARDFEFSHALSSVLAGQQKQTMGLSKTDGRHLGPDARNQLEVALMYRNDIQPSIDGNTVDMNTETANFTDNAVRYQASITFMQQRIAGLRAALQSQ
ncbi:flagellar basal body rod protein FlgB [Chitinimonas sp.]|uniref:flagellar basal body rod protein FlgB n=1 Tax=Chitinimonas sp. TaxID=1934313 RepID=UPI0035B0CF3E